jgi:hypothetical protein
MLKASYGRLTDGIARNRTLPAARGFTGDELISTYSELMLIDQYVNLEKQETRQFGQMVATLEKIPIYNIYLNSKEHRQQTGVGPAMAGVIITYLDPHKARHVSSFWMYAGLDVGPDGKGRSRRQEHLVERTYIDKDGNEKTRMGMTFNPFLKTKLIGVLAVSFLRSGSPWRKVYDDYKHRLETDPHRIKITVDKWKKLNKTETEEEMKKYWPPGRIHRASMRYMIKMFLKDLWKVWRELEGLEVTEEYAVAKLGFPPHGAGHAAE